jgi:hypothetical protein
MEALLLPLSVMELRPKQRLLPICVRWSKMLCNVISTMRNRCLKLPACISSATKSCRYEAAAQSRRRPANQIRHKQVSSPSGNRRTGLLLFYSVLAFALVCSLGGKGCCGLQQEYKLQSRVQPGVDERPPLLAKEQVRRSAVRARGQYRAGR